MRRNTAGSSSGMPPQVGAVSSSRRASKTSRENRYLKGLFTGIILSCASAIITLLIYQQTSLRTTKPTALYGSLGPADTDRTHLRYYDTLYSLAVQFGQDTQNVLEVGCAQDPFVKHLDWIPDKQCVAPYYVKYSGTEGTTTALPPIDFVKADFFEWEPPIYYDLLICSQVAEHVNDPKTFVRKLLDTAEIVIVSVPYNWKPSKTANHKTHYIDLDKVLEWTSPRKPVISTIVKDGALERLIVVFLEGEQ